ncbi:MAG: hypothetical protein J7480_00045 [Microbacteriaceae bacterium]|nr:hypothetical protein [Microbacteriaceae bacterium]
MSDDGAVSERMPGDDEPDVPEIAFAPAQHARPTAPAVKWFVAVVLAVFAAGIVALIVAMATTVAGG